MCAINEIITKVLKTNAFFRGLFHETGCLLIIVKVCCSIFKASRLMHLGLWKIERRLHNTLN